jgi:hypothetical protein
MTIVNTPTSPLPKARPVVGRVDDNNTPYQMPEDINAFDAFWTLAECELGRHLDYEEVIVLFNQDRRVSTYFIED